MFVSPSMSLVVAGVASGICFLIYNGILKGKSGDSNDDEPKVPVDDNRCSCCLRPLFLGRSVRCKDCGAKSCRTGCSRWDTTDKFWRCLFCHQQRYWSTKNKLESCGDKLIKEEDLHRYFDTARSRVYVAGVENAATSSGQNLAAEREETNTMETVRDFVEKIVESLIGSLKETPINRLYDHPAYDKLLEEHIAPLVDALTRLGTALQLSLKNKPNTDSPTMAHTALRDIVERVVEEARKLPVLGGSGGNGNSQGRRNIVEQSYEDLLASAILNKVIEKFQKEQVDGNSNVLRGKPESLATCTLSESEIGLDEGVEEGCSSLEPLSQDDCCSDCSPSCTKRLRHQPETLSLTIEERIEEVTTTYNSDEDQKENDALVIRNVHRVPFPELGMDIIDPSQESDDSQDEPDIPTTQIDMISPVESWEENWLFQRKRIQTKADPVAMLVPNPSADFKALIGDKDAEDTSDLSDCSSTQSDEEIEKELIEAINNVVPRSPKETEFVNCLERHTSDISDNQRLREACVKSFPKDSRVVERTIDEKTEKQNETLREKETGENQSPMEIGHKRSKDVKEKKSMSNETENNTALKEIVEVDCKNLNKTETMYEITREKSMENTVEIESNRSLKMLNSGATKKNELIEKRVSNDDETSDTPTIFITEENIPIVPKTPSCTPTRITMAKIRLENEDDAEMMASRNENILSSLECAKKKLMAVNDDIVEPSKEEEERSGQEKADFHAEDIQQESEYTEHYDTATQRHLDSLTKAEQSEFSENNESKCREAVALAKAESASHASLQIKKSEEDVRFAAPPKPGTIAEREHRKWENAPPIQNNPYSQENIQKRLWERQYWRRSSDISGTQTELPKSNGEDLDVVLAPPEPDIKRFGRDYYINDSRASMNEKGRRSAASTSSRPSSSLSQRSSSTGTTDQDQQEETHYKETESLFTRSNDVKSKVAKWQNNSAENKYQSSVRANDSSNESEKFKEKSSMKIQSQKSWDDQRLEEILENERKNSKNAINAKLNNQENYENSVLDGKKINCDENQRKISRIDLKAYGFENEFISNKTIRSSTPRVVNKLDLKSFGYDGGIRRTQSNIQLNSIDNDEFKSRFFRVVNKSNLTLRNNFEDDHDDMIENARACGDNVLTQSTDTLNKFDAECYGDFKLKSAKSVPNIAKFYSNGNNREDEEVESYNQNSYEEFRVIKNGSVRDIAKNYATDKYNIKSSDSSMDESELDTDNSSEREPSQHSLNDYKKKSLTDEEIDNRVVLPMPSVKRLAEAFSKQSETVAVPASKVSKSNNVYKERSSTPEVQIVETPRQMHSLTARSLSKQFREGLKQIPNKVTSPPASHVTIEQSNVLENQTEVVQGKIENSSSDTNVISPGKLKSNIIFWEQMQKKI